MGKPKASRPHMPGYGIADAKTGQGLLPWRWAEDRLEQGRTYWIATAGPDAKPHVMPVWGVWFSQAFFFSTGGLSRKARNLAFNSRCSIATEIDFQKRPKKGQIKDAVILEGVAELLKDSRTRTKFATIYEAKYTYNLWRPVTAIRSADMDGNPQTAVDLNWLPPAGNTAADPSYPGAHATISAGGAFVLNTFFGRKPFHLNVTSEVLPGVTRSFDSFTAVEKEASVSRVYAGQHFRSDEDAGERLGRAVADFVVDNFLTRVSGRDGRDRDDDDNY